MEQAASPRARPRSAEAGVLGDSAILTPPHSTSSASVWGTPCCGPSLPEGWLPPALPFPAGAGPPALPQCVPLLKFRVGEELPHLEEEGLAKLASLPPPVSIVTFLGDGRCGKSTLASRLVADGHIVFPVGDTGEPVTCGIDLCAVPRPGAEGSLVVFDCEGGNNPTGAIRSAVDVMAMLGSTLTVQVVWGQMGEGQLQQIGQGLAARDRLLTGTSSRGRLPAQRLLLVVNGCHLRYAPGHLAAAFLEVHEGSERARSELRANIKRAYEQIHFVTVPHELDPSHREQLASLKRATEAHCSPVALGGSQLSGAQVAELLKSAVGELQSAGAVPVPSVFRHVIFDHMLMPLVDRLCADFEQALPELSDGEYRRNTPDNRARTLESFGRESRQLTYAELVAEARKELGERIDRAWLHFSTRNEAIGEQDRDVTTEFDTRYSHSEERVVSWKRTCLVMGKRRPVVQACNVFRVWTRTRVLKKNGHVAYSEWLPSSTAVESPNAGSLNTQNGSLDACDRSCSPARPLVSRHERSCSAPPKVH